MSQNLQLSSIQTAVVCICRVTFILYEVFYIVRVYQYTECPHIVSMCDCHVEINLLLTYLCHSPDKISTENTLY